MLTLFRDAFFDPFDGVLDAYRCGNTPQVNVIKSDDGYNVQMAVPGLTGDDLKIIVKEGVLKISYEKEEKSENSYFITSFSKSYSLPEYVNEDNIKGKVENGILDLKLPLNKKKISEKLIELK